MNYKLGLIACVIFAIVSQIFVTGVIPNLMVNFLFGAILGMYIGKSKRKEK